MTGIQNARVWELYKSREVRMCRALVHVDCCVCRSCWHWVECREVKSTYYRQYLQYTTQRCSKQ